MLGRRGEEGSGDWRVRGRRWTKDVFVGGEEEGKRRQRIRIGH